MSQSSKVVSSRDMPQSPRWVEDMHAHFARTGQYRPKDLERVLGDQRTTVESPQKHEPAAGNLKK
jgi:hypothetical protein